MSVVKTVRYSSPTHPKLTLYLVYLAVSRGIVTFHDVLFHILSFVIVSYSSANATRGTFKQLLQPATTCKHDAS